MEQAPPDLERQWQPAPLEPLGHPSAGLQAAVNEEAEGSGDEGPGDGTVRRGGSRGRGAWCPGLPGRAGLARAGAQGGCSAGAAPQGGDSRVEGPSHRCSEGEAQWKRGSGERRASWGCATKGWAEKAAAAVVRGAEEMCGCGRGMEVGARTRQARAGAVFRGRGTWT